jgi:hypothetical protein
MVFIDANCLVYAATSDPTVVVLDSIVAAANQIGIEPFTFLRNVLTRLPDQPANTRHELLPAAWAQAQRQQAESRP